MHLNLPQGSGRKKLLNTESGLAEDGAKRSFWKITGMIRNGGVAISSLLIPDFMRACGLTIKSKAATLQPLHHVSGSIPRQAAH